MKCEIIEIPSISEKRGNICFAENDALPFAVQRVFWIYNVGKGQTRGGHVHRTCHEIVIPVCGAFSIKLTDGKEEKILRMDTATKGVVIPAMTWCDLFDFTPDAVCLCLASEPYDAKGYIHSMDAFMKEVKQ